MKNIAIIDFTKHKEMIMCVSRGCTTKPESTPKKYYSYKHAQDDGWICTDHIQYCPPDVESVWICPECAKKQKWIKK